ncbi:MAG TPA: hypothetical protein VJ843_05475 [Candidatus Saccharimonadales bacterium]|nr:hypothetical protein [Candidatus Saccharimonadales bacterium]
MADQNLRLALLRHHLIALLIGGGLGVISRLALAKGLTNEQILDSRLGLAVLVGIAGGFVGILSGWQRRRPFRYYLGVILIVAGLAWVIPFPH